MGSDSEWEGNASEFDDDGLSEFLKEFERSPEGPSAKEEAWFKALIDGLGPAGPWREAVKVLEKYSTRAANERYYFNLLYTQLESVRLNTTVGDRFTSKEARAKGVEAGPWIFEVLVRKGALKIAAKRILGACGRGRIRNVFERVA